MSCLHPAPCTRGEPDVEVARESGRVGLWHTRSFLPNLLLSEEGPRVPICKTSGCQLVLQQARS
jgi:hypothetical protein